VAGRWTPDEPAAISVEDGLAETLGLKLGDRLTLRHGRHAGRGPHHQPAQGGLGLDAGELLRHVPGGQLPDVPVTYISAYRRPSTPGFRQRAGAAFPNITNVDMSSTIAQVQRVLGQVIRAVEFLFGFTLAAGLVVLFAAVTATRGEREREFAILRAVGAGRSLLRRCSAPNCWAWAAGGLAGVAGGGGRGLGAGALRLRIQLERLALGAAGRRLAGGVLALAAGWWGLRSVLRTPVVETLRKAAQ
jgi:putative ABC transport system permease protein